jgi:hypothetical protein
MAPAKKDQLAGVRNQYRTTARVQMNDRHLLLRGGVYDGMTWVGVVAVGDRVFCGGDAPWSLAGMYLVTEAVADHEGEEVSIAVPVFAGG